MRTSTYCDNNPNDPTFQQPYANVYCVISKDFYIIQLTWHKFFLCVQIKVFR